ncbi:hypothetical protein MVEN_02306300 [Mycena venus]|uniref:Uncharacterized protein n=1 Tax=Mycena venus TaxID=2733690 RepID=A0A8H6X4H1_9AGAR|nr:hypothetical protein MVEN_02306300 [Mycena venus]
MESLAHTATRFDTSDQLSNFLTVVKCNISTFHRLSDSIDPNLRNQGAAPPSPKRARRNNGQRYRKIVEENPLELVKDCISARMISRFQTGWLEHGAAVEAANSTQPADKYVSLRDTAIEILDHVSDFVEEHKFSDAQFRWIEYNGGVVTFSLLTSLYNWLVTNELMVGNIQKKPVPRKVTVKITDVNGKRITMSSSMLNDARINPSLYPGVVEEGIEAVLENGWVKCLTCDSTGLRGQALEQRPIPPQEDHPYLKDCKCPLCGAALELWMVKVLEHTGFSFGSEVNTIRVICGAASCGLAPARFVPDTHWFSLDLKTLPARHPPLPSKLFGSPSPPYISTPLPFAKQCYSAALEWTCYTQSIHVDCATGVGPASNDSYMSPPLADADLARVPHARCPLHRIHDFKLAIVSSSCAATSRSPPHDAVPWVMRLPWQPTRYPKHTLSVARSRILRAVLCVALARLPANFTSPSLNDELRRWTWRAQFRADAPDTQRLTDVVDTVHFLRRCTIPTSNLHCFLLPARSRMLPLQALCVRML